MQLVITDGGKLNKSSQKFHGNFFCALCQIPEKLGFQTVMLEMNTAGKKRGGGLESKKFPVRRS